MKNIELQKAWEQSAEAPFIGILRKVEAENISEALAGEESWRKAFDTGSKEKVLLCSDERVQPVPGEFKLGVAGQLILCSPEEREKFIQDWKGKIKAVRSHSGCGAAGVAYEKLSTEARSNYQDGENPADEYGKVFSEELAKKLEAEFEHLPFSGMRGNKDFHDARIIFWSSNPNFDPSVLNENFLPPHFLANGAALGLNENYCREELKILTGIALGHHGFGELFAEANPFYVISVGKDAKNLNEMAKDTLKEFGGRISFKFIEQ